MSDDNGPVICQDKLVMCQRIRDMYCVPLTGQDTCNLSEDKGHVLTG